MPAQAAIDVTRFGTIVRSGIISARSRWARLRRLLPLSLNLPIAALSADGYAYLARLRGRRRTLRLRSVLAGRTDERTEDAPKRLRGLLDETLVAKLLEDAVNDVLAELAVRVLAAAVTFCTFWAFLACFALMDSSYLNFP